MILGGKISSPEEVRSIDVSTTSTTEASTEKVTTATTTTSTTATTAPTTTLTTASTTAPTTSTTATTTTKIATAKATETTTIPNSGEPAATEGPQSIRIKSSNAKRPSGRQQGGKPSLLETVLQAKVANSEAESQEGKNGQSEPSSQQKEKLPARAAQENSQPSIETLSIKTAEPTHRLPSRQPEIEEVRSSIAIIEAVPVPTRPSPVFRPSTVTLTTVKTVSPSNEDTSTSRPQPQFRPTSQKTVTNDESRRIEADIEKENRPDPPVKRPRNQPPVQNINNRPSTVPPNLQTTSVPSSSIIATLSAGGGESEVAARNNFLKLLSKNRPRPDAEPLASSTSEAGPVERTTFSSSMSPLENLLNIANKKSDKEEEVKVIKVVKTSSSSSSSSSSSTLEVPPRLQGVKKKKSAGASRPTENTSNPPLLNLSPQAGV